MYQFRNLYKVAVVSLTLLCVHFQAQAQGTALSFDGIDDHVTTVAKSTTVDGSFTVMAWVKPMDATKAMHIFSTREPAEFGFDMQLKGGNLIHGDIGNGSSFLSTSADATYKYTVGQWLHVAYTVTANEYKIYANGKKLVHQSLGSTPLLLNSTHQIVIGKNANEGTYFKGSIDEVKVYNAVLTEAQINADMLSSTSAVPGNLIAHYDFNQTGTSLTDLSGNGYTGTVTNFDLTGTTSNWVESYAMVVPVVAPADNVLPSGFTANWTAPVNGIADSYAVEVAKDAEFAQTILGSPFSAAGVSQQITGLLSGTDYYYRVRANKATVSGDGIFSEGQKVTTAPAFDYLSSLTFTDISLTPGFSANQLSYAAVTANIDFRLRAVQSNASSLIEMSVNGGSFSAISSGALSAAIPLNLGSNTVVIKVTDGLSSRTYTIAVNRVSPTVRYVTENGAGSKDGSSWGNASNDLQLMINTSAPHDMVWVAAGTYKPTRRAENLSSISPGSRFNSFVLQADVQVYGGFSGSEALLKDRNYQLHETILSGDYNGDDVLVGSKSTLNITNQTENAFHVIMSVGAIGNAVLDGFTITGGYANDFTTFRQVNGSYITDDYGAGIFILESSPKLRNLQFTKNKAYLGGAIAVDLGQPIIENVVISKNRAVSGGGIMNTLSTLFLDHVTISDNNVTANGGGIINLEATSHIVNAKFIGNQSVNQGGAIYNTEQSSMTLSNSSMIDNVSNDFGGAISNLKASPTQITNVLFKGNIAHSGGAIANAENSVATFTNVTITKNIGATYAGGIENYGTGTVIVRNSIIWDNPSPTNKVIRSGTNPAVVSHSLIEGGYSGIGNIDADPQFRNIAGHEFELKQNSPAIDAGSVTYYGTSQTPNLSAITKDLNDNNRVHNAIIDMGAYEAYLGSVALNFDGVDDHVTFTAPPTAIAHSFTVQAWLRPTDASKTMHILSTKTAGGYGFDIQLKNGNTIQANIGSANQWLTNTADISYDYTAGRWMHVAYSVSPTGFKAYVNGALKASGTFTGSPLLMDNDHLLQLGNNGSENTFFKGEMDELRIYDKALTEAEINQEMIMAVTGLPNHLLSFYNFDQGVPQVNNAGNIALADEGQYNQTGTLMGFTLNGSQSNWVESYAMIIPEVAVPIVLSPSSFQSRWSEPKLGVVDNGYVLEVATDQEFISPVVGSPFAVSEGLKTLSGLTPNTTYYYRVAADKLSVGNTGAYSKTMVAKLQSYTPPGNALHFDGSNDHVIMPAKGTIVGGNFTVMAWVKPTNATKAMHIFSAREGGENTFDMQLTGGNKIHGDIGKGTSWMENQADADYKYQVNQWLHVAYVVTPTAYRIYANGVDVGGGSLLDAAVLFGATHYITLGKNHNENTYFQGSMDEVRVYSTALSAADIRTNMLSATITHPSSLIAYYNFDQAIDSQSDVLTDQGNNGYHGSVNNFALSGSTSNWVESYAMVVPTLNEATTVRPTQFTANWTAPVVGTVDNGYFLEVATDDAFTQMIANSPFQVNDISKEITGLTTGTTYYYRVRADKNSVSGQGATSAVKTAVPAKQNQVITFAALDPKTTASTDYALSATASSGLAVTYTSSNTAVAEVYQDAGVWKVKIKGEGNTDITASQTGDGNYSAATAVVQQLIVTGGPLPVTLINYTAKAEGSSAKLQWQTTQEVNNLQFTIYRSGDDKAFVKIGEVSASINHQPLTINHYSYVDKQPLNGNNYYKLMQIDHNGQATSLGERALNFKLSTLDFQVYPNPTRDQVNISFAGNSYHELQVLDAIGNVKQKHRLHQTATSYVVHLNDYPSGLYFIKLHSAKGTVLAKVMKY